MTDVKYGPNNEASKQLTKISSILKWFNESNQEEIDGHDKLFQMPLAIFNRFPFNDIF